VAGSSKFVIVTLRRAYQFRKLQNLPKSISKIALAAVRDSEDVRAATQSFQAE
jgi:hypothetical protein